MAHQIMVSATVTAWEYLKHLSGIYWLTSKEGRNTGRASNSELKRWIQNKSLLINTEHVTWDEQIDFPVFSVILFPKSVAHRITLV